MSTYKFEHGLVVALVFATASFPSVAAAQPGSSKVTSKVETSSSESPRRTATRSNPYFRSDVLMWTALGLGALHHTDHVLRTNHSGFPFERQVNEFTFSLSVYPLLLGGYFMDAGPNYWILTESVTLVGLGLAHTLIEPPEDQHNPWAEGTNLLGTSSHAAGRGAQVLSVALSAGVGAHLVSSIVDGAKCGFTWKRKKTCSGDNAGSRSARFSVAPTKEGMKATVGIRW